MITRKEVLKLTGAGALALAASRAAAAMAGAAPLAGAGDDLRRLTTADLRALPRLEPAASITRTGQMRAFTLVLALAPVEPLPGHHLRVPTVNGSSPGPVLRMIEGDNVEITVINRMTQPTGIHWHGVPVPFSMDGVPLISQKPIAPNGRFVYRWIAPQAGTYMYHAHFHELEQDTIVGMIVVTPQESSREPSYAKDVPIAITTVPWEQARRPEARAVLSDSMMMSSMSSMGSMRTDPLPGVGDPMERMDMVEYWCLNGKTFPATAPIHVRSGDLVRVRFANVTHMAHPMHLHGHWFRLIAQDGVPLPEPRPMNTIPVDPGRTADIDFIANNPGVWPLHCHIVSHMADNKDQMSGLVTVVQYEGYTLPATMAE